MKLNVSERMLLLGVLPEQGSFTTLKVIRELREAVAPSPELWTRCAGVEADSRVRWGPRPDMSSEHAKQVEEACLEEAEIEIPDAANELIVKALKTLNEQEKLTLGHFSLYDKFVEDPLYQAALEREKVKAKGVAP